MMRAALLGCVLALAPNMSAGERILDCTSNAITKSRCMIDAVLADLQEVDGLEGGGGVSAILLEATNVYSVSIAQEGRVSTYTYHLDVSDAGEVRILDRQFAVQAK